MSDPPQKLTNQSISSLEQLLGLAWPIVVQLLSFSLMTLVDTLFVAQLGESALAAVGLGGMSVFCVAAFGIGTFVGAKVQVSQAFGGGESARVERLLGCFMRLAVLAAMALTPLALGAAFLMPQVSADASTGQLALEYAFVRAWALPVLLGIAALGQHRQGVGDSQSAMRAALVANAFNLPLNALFIFYFGWGVLGAGLATLGARVVELLVLILVQRKHGFGTRPEPQELRRLIAFSVPVGVERWLDVAAFAVLVVLLGRMGATEVAAHQITLQIAHFGFLPIIALSEALSVLIAQAYGAGRIAHLRVLVRQAFGLACLYAALGGGLCLSFSDQLIAVFTQDETLALATNQTLYAGALLLVLHAVYSVLKGALRGTGDVKVVAVVSVSTAWILSPPLTYGFHAWFGLGAAGGWCALCVEVAAGVAILAPRLGRVIPRGKAPAPSLGLGIQRA